VERKYITVSALNKYLKFRLDNDQNLQNVLLKAEISNFKRHSRGHIYFTLKDEESQIAAMMFFNNAKSLVFEPKEGDKVIVEGYVSVYENAGTYQIYVTKMSLAGIGDLYQAYELLKQQLAAKGLFAAEHKRKLPLYPTAIGVITSPTGAAVHDVINIINRRFPLSRIYVYPALVQGEGAKASLVSMIEKANQDQLCDILIVGRGGGSIEDLWAFNEEVVANAVYESQIPIISAVGHETDFTIIDFVADLRAPTPSGAAELVVPDQIMLLQNIAKLKQKLNYLLDNQIHSKLQRLQVLTETPIFRHPDRLFEKNTLHLITLTSRLEQTDPLKIFTKNQLLIDNLTNRLNFNFRLMFDRQSHKYQTMINKLELLNPLTIMKKGYSIIKKGSKIIRSVTEMSINDSLSLALTDGTAECVVNKIRKEA
jgi:exodeoxyribonuclease VII large subunit